MPSPYWTRTRIRALSGALVLLVVAALLTGWLLWPRDGRVHLKTWQEGGRGDANLAGSFPQPPDPPIYTPHGIAYRDGRVFVSEADAGRIRVFREDGGRMGSIPIPPASGVSTSYPTDIAFVSESTLAVVDTAGRRVVLVDVGTGVAKPLDARPATSAPVQPTAVASLSASEFAVADGASKVVRVFGLDGAFHRDLGVELMPRFTFVTGMAMVAPGELACSDGNAARTLTLDPATGALRRILPDRFQLARGIAPQSAGVFWVVDALARNVERWSTDETRTAVIAGDASDYSPAALLSSPRCAVWVAATNRLYVTDPGADQIKIYNVSPDGSK